MPEWLDETGIGLEVGMLGGVQHDAPEWRLPMTGTTSAGTVQLADDLVLTRMGYGAMQLAGPMVGDRRRTGTPRRACSAPSSTLASPTSTPATTTARTRSTS